MPTVDLDDIVRMNPGVWLETYGYIRDVGGKKSRPVMNVLQRRMNAIYVSRLIAKRPMRGLVVKPRKRGASTMVGAHHYAQLQNFQHEGFIIGDRSETSGVVFEILRFYAENDEFRGKWGSQLVDNSSEKLSWAHGSKAEIGTAQGKASSRGRTPQFVHETEKSHWEHAEETSDAVRNAVPDEGFTVIWEESTPFGFDNLFSNDWQRGRWPTEEECPDGGLYWKQWENVCPDQPAAGRTDLDYVRCFAAWYEFDTPGAESFIRLTDEEKAHIQNTLDGESWYRGERDLISRYGNEGPVGIRLGLEVTRCDVWEQLAWRRSTIKNKCRANLDTFNSEHPSDPKTCFVSSGKGVFDSDSVDRVHARSEQVTPEYGQIEIIERVNERRAGWKIADSGTATIWVWEPPKIGCRYIMSIDLSEGNDQTKGDDPDAHSALVLRDSYIERETGVFYRKRLVARVCPENRWPMIPFVRLCAGLGLYYGNCMQIPEMNNSGLAYITAMKASFPWVPLWKRREVDPITGKTIKEMDGWRTTDTAGFGGVRSQIITVLHDDLREDRIDIGCPAVHSQLLNFVRKPSGKMEAGTGHDDDVISISIGNFNIGDGTIMEPPLYRNAFIPPEVQALLDEEAMQPGGIAQRW